MINHLRKETLEKYCSRFGQLAVEFGFITETQLTEARAFQVHQNLDGNEHPLLKTILFEKKLMSASQIEHVMTELFQRMRQEHHDEGIVP